jgi:hypothetical protein
MMNGDFENLPGKGRPLKIESNPHADPAEDMAYRILAKNGFAPEWVELNKDIRVMIQRWRTALALAYQRKLKVCGSEGESETVTKAWKLLLTEFEVELGDINRKVRTQFFTINYKVMQDRKGILMSPSDFEFLLPKMW